jgi:hypothetical protein
VAAIAEARRNQTGRVLEAGLVDYAWKVAGERLAALDMALARVQELEDQQNAVLDMLDRLPAKATTVSVRKVREALS